MRAAYLVPRSHSVGRGRSGYEIRERQDTKRQAGVFPYMAYYVRGYAAGLGMVYALSVLKGVYNYRKTLS